jgi:hypothetical protein
VTNRTVVSVISWPALEATYSQRKERIRKELASLARKEAGGNTTQNLLPPSHTQQQQWRASPRSSPPPRSSTSPPPPRPRPARAACAPPSSPVRRATSAPAASFAASTRCVAGRWVSVSVCHRDQGDAPLTGMFSGFCCARGLLTGGRGVEEAARHWRWRRRRVAGVVVAQGPGARHRLQGAAGARRDTLVMLGLVTSCTVCGVV